MSQLESLSIALIGGGNMARGIIGGLIGKGARASSITVSEPLEASRQALVRDFGVRVTVDNAEAVRAAKVVVLAVKPQLMSAVARALAPALRESSPLVISVAAGIRADRLQHWLGAGIAVVRSMPNRPLVLLYPYLDVFAEAMNDTFGIKGIRFVKDPVIYVLPPP